jgi:hypothetical protein
MESHVPDHLPFMFSYLVRLKTVRALVTQGQIQA